MSLLLELHPIVSFLILAVLSIAFSILGVKIVRKRIPHEALRENHEVAGFIFNAFGLIYAVLVAFVVFAVWNSYDNAEKDVEMEVNKLSDMFFDANAFPDTMKKEIRIAVTEYTKSVVELEWNAMSNKERAPQSSIDAIRKIWNAYIKIDTKLLSNPYMYEESLRQLNSMSEYRRLRWVSSRNSVPAVIWLVLIVGGLASIVYTFFFGTKHAKAQYFMTSVLTIINALVLFLIYILDHPFTGYSAISNDIFKTSLNMFQKIIGL